MTLVDRAALVTGSKRIGAVVAAHLAERGVDVVVTFNRSRAEAEAAVDVVRSLGRRAELEQADLSNPGACRDVVARVRERMGRLDILVNMASHYSARPLDDTTDADWERQLAVDLLATWACSHAAIRPMREAGGGRIVNFTDWVVRSGRPRYTGFTPYYVAKAGVLALTESLALELAPDRILVNAIAPGPIVAPPGTSDEELREVERSTPLGRWGGEGEVAKAVVFLCETDFVTGETIRVDGGRHLR